MPIYFVESPLVFEPQDYRIHNGVHFLRVSVLGIILG